MYLLGQKYQYRVALVDHVGADLIATNRLAHSASKKKYAISVKTRRFKTDDPSTSLNMAQQQALRKFAQDFALTPAVAWVLISPSERNGGTEIIDVYIVSLNAAVKLAKEGSRSSPNGFSANKNGDIRIKNTAKNMAIHALNKQNIAHSRLEIAGFDSESSWLA